MRIVYTAPDGRYEVSKTACRRSHAADLTRGYRSWGWTEFKRKVYGRTETGEDLLKLCFIRPSWSVGREVQP